MAFLDDTGVTKLVSYLKTKIQALLSTALDTKQDTLVSGYNIKTINYNNTILGTGNLVGRDIVSAGTGLSYNSSGTSLYVDLSNAVNSTSETTAATSKAVYDAYELASQAYDEATNEPLFQVKTYTYTYSVAASGSTNVTKANLGITVPDGYSMGGYLGISTANANVVPRSWNPMSTQTGTSIVLRNVSTTAVSSQKLTVNVLYLATAHVGT